MQGLRKSPSSSIDEGPQRYKEANAEKQKPNGES